MTDNIMACRACLNTDVKMVEMNLTSLSEAYYNITGIKVYDPLNYVCFECSALLIKCQNFRNKCLRANNVVLNILKSHEKITESLFKEVNRKLYKLETLYTIHQNNFIKCLQDENKLKENYIYDSDCFSALKLETKSNKEDIKIEVNSIDNETNSINNETNSIDNETNSIDNETNSIDNEINSFDNETNSINNETNSIDNESNSIDNEINSFAYETNSINNDVSKDNDDYIAFEVLENEIEDESNNINYDSSSDCILKEYITKRKKKRGRPRKNVEVKEKHSMKKRKRGGPKLDMSYFDEYATIVELTTEMAEREMLLRKQSSNYISCSYKCEFCYRGFEAENAFNNHMKKHSNEFGSYECEFCHLKFPSNKAWCKHLLSCHKRKFSCKLCPYICFCSSQARSHIDLHKGKKYICSECGVIFSLPNSLLMHKSKKHPKECVCTYCGSTFANKRGLRTHILLLHRLDNEDMQGPLCEECNIQFATVTAFKRHLVLSSKHKFSNGCETCGQIFDNPQDLKEHLRTHARKQSSRPRRKRPAACPLCSKCFPTPLQYREHVMRAHPTSTAAARVRHDMQAVCETCGAGFKKRHFLIYHQRTHAGDQCGDKSVPPAAAACHHPHTCHLCRNTYQTKGALFKHLKAHLGIRPHKCKICDKSFPNSYQVRLHMQHVHDRVPWPKRDRTKRKKPSDRSDEHTNTD